MGEPNSITLRQNEGIVGIQDGRDLLSVYADPGEFGLEEGLSGGPAQLGLPRLPELASPYHFTLLKEWIRVCDTDHDTCRRQERGKGDESTAQMPTRLLEVGRTLRLVDSASLAEPSRYIALSHCWGKLSPTERLCTLRINLEAHKSCIAANIDQLPRSFRDAVVVSRGIGVKYLWIDSLCIIQDDDEDWEYEAARMEQVFSNAYLTIAASSARSSIEGFLGPRLSRPCICLRMRVLGTSKDVHFYVCPAIDDFSRDVDDSNLSRRGWVLQERALSRRTIFYTLTQVYWECGAGVHCETLARLQNSKAAFLGDANFPESAQKYYRDGRQALVQELYERYTALAFSNPTDRPIAILGLQKRLARVYQTFAAYGCFAAYFARGLLWRCRDSRRMTRLPPPSGHRLPSWSWFSKDGAIKYLPLKFTQIDWTTGQEFENPFEKSRPESSGDQTLQPPKAHVLGSWDPRLTILRGLARRIVMSQLDLLISVTFDLEGEFQVAELLCVVIGRDKVVEDASASTYPRKYHVLVIRPATASVGEGGVQGSVVYERVGVASLRPEYVVGEGHWVEIW